MQFNTTNMNTYIDSSEQQSANSPNPQLKADHLNRYCLQKNPESYLLQQSQYDKLVQQLLQHKISKQSIRKLITNIEDKTLVENIDKRNIGYQYFLKRIEIDKKYEALQNQKVKKLKEVNEKKKQLLRLYKMKQQYEESGNQLKKYAIEKKQREQRVVQHLKEDVRKLGNQRVYSAHRKMKEMIKLKKFKQDDEIQSRLNRKMDELKDLKEELERVRQEKHINKLEQRKVLRAMEENISGEINELKIKAGKRREFQV